MPMLLKLDLNRETLFLLYARHDEEQRNAILVVCEA